jgi:hypothetical protein
MREVERVREPWENAVGEPLHRSQFEPLVRTWTENGEQTRADKRRTSEAYGAFVASIRRWDVFGGLTYRSQASGTDATRLRGPRPLELVKRDVEWWIREVRRQAHLEVEAAVVAIESHRSGWPHIHPLLGLRGGLQEGDLKRLWQVWYERYGGGKLSAPRSQGEVSAYACKYLTKDIARGDVMILPRAARSLAQLRQRQLGFEASTGCIHQERVR